jgi:hypothetical protein
LKKFIALILSLTFCLPLFAGCSKPPELDTVKEELIAVLEQSYEVNEILFGKGLVTEYELSGIVEEYTDEIKNYENYYSDEQVYYNVYSPVVKTYMKDTDGDGVGDTETVQPTTVAEIKALAEKVYSTSFLTKTYAQMFDGSTVNVNGSNESIKARYRDGFKTDEGEAADADAEKVLRKYKYIDSNNMDYIDARGGRTVYDYSTMKISFPSNSKAFYVTMDSWLEDSPSVVTSVRLRFVLQDGQWYLDSFTG